MVDYTQISLRKDIVPRIEVLMKKKNMVSRAELVRYLVNKEDTDGD